MFVLLFGFFFHLPLFPSFIVQFLLIYPLHRVDDTCPYVLFNVHFGNILLIFHGCGGGEWNRTFYNKIWNIQSERWLRSRIYLSLDARKYADLYIYGHWNIKVKNTHISYFIRTQWTEYVCSNNAFMMMMFTLTNALVHIYLYTYIYVYFLPNKPIDISAYEQFNGNAPCTMHTINAIETYGRKSWNSAVYMFTVKFRELKRKKK